MAGPCRCLHLGGPRRVELLSSLQQDVAWLELHNVMDYSLLVGVACPSSPSPSSPTIQDLLAKLPGGGDEAERHRRYSLWSPMSKAEGAEPGPTAVGHATEKPEAPPAERQQEGEEGEGGHVFLLGLVDVLQEYNLKKKMETLYKTGLYSFEVSTAATKGPSVIQHGLITCPCEGLGASFTRRRDQLPEFLCPRLPL